ncbi:putative DNA replication protein [Streptococcus pseudoporcinus]|uniref:Putative DNA replication protein n=1 Tax=Streptococcus pseudoporcinus TaxID=361101 RepID=A0A4U9Y0D9_9STRE|nr:DnaD domain protein [Streptococcus pseudoporcinus]QBX18691.1 DNA replication protein [Streptococcus phage Javan443]QBX18790.1 DNA replication protein [Streptococcus phage Javan445]VTS19494.1 putative DNA replication protein [Streptococcus pseudoporcinus]VUC69781.1 putative DNA replication protein [Streptococcus pseudoporcinus]VUD00035.1 putative DNA replication protein [Streptococcus pseudoporcinus]
MGNRRMISKTVTQTQKFLRLPLETQALYFHLIQNADDDGVVEAFPVVRMIGSSEDSLGLLVIKQFIKPLNDEMVYFLTDFREQNTIRRDRYTPSVYKDLLVGLPIGNQSATSGKPNISKDNTSKYNTSKDKTTTNSIFDFIQNEFGRLLSPMEIETIRMMIKENNHDLIKEAIKRTKLQGKTNLNYVRGILRNWRDDNITTIEQIEAKEKSRKSKQEEVSEYDTW